jgi:hypothetical protein
MALLWLSLLALLSCLADAAIAHGAVPPKHGGITSSGETTFEMVHRSSETIFFVEDHGVPIDMSGAKGTLTVHRATGADTRDAIGRAPNVVATKRIRLSAGDRLTVRMVMPNGDVHIGRFAMQ